MDVDRTTEERLRGAAQAVDTLWDEPDSATEDARDGLIWMTDDEGAMAVALRALRAALATAEQEPKPLLHLGRSQGAGARDGLDYGESRETLTTGEVAARLDLPERVVGEPKCQLCGQPITTRPDDPATHIGCCLADNAEGCCQPAAEALIVGRLALGDPTGACMRACLATITGLDIPDIDDGPGWFEQYQTRLRRLGWVLETSSPTRPVVGFSVAIGPSAVGPEEDHAMVALDGVVIWDPGTGRTDAGGWFVPRSFCPVRRLSESERA